MTKKAKSQECSLGFITGLPYPSPLTHLQLRQIPLYPLLPCRHSHPTQTPAHPSSQTVRGAGTPCFNGGHPSLLVAPQCMRLD